MPASVCCASTRPDTEPSTCRVNEPTTTTTRSHQQQQVQNGNMTCKGSAGDGQDVAVDETTADETTADETTTTCEPAASVSWQDRLKMQDNLIDVLKQEKEKQLLDIANHLMVMEAELRKEQNKILDLIQAKDRTIALQEKQLQALLVLNRKLSAKMDRHRHCSHCKQSAAAAAAAESAKSRHHFSDPTEMLRQILRNNRTCRSASDASVDRNDDDDGGKNHLAKSIACKLDKKAAAAFKSRDAYPAPDTDKPEWSNLYAIEEAVRSYDQVTAAADPPPFPAPNFCHLQTLEELDESEEMHVNEADDGEPFLVERYADDGGGGGGDKGNQLSVCYNRVMSNHRNVTKPKDVKYKKINRVKSRSLEELRGKLRNWTPPFFLSEKST